MKLKISNKLLAACLVTAAAMSGSCTSDKKEEPKRVIVKTAQPVAATDSEGEEYSFMAKPWRTSELSFRVGGPIDRLDVHAGNSYRRGSIIAEIDPRDFRIRKAKAEAAYRQQEAEWKRVAALYEKDNVSASQYDKAKADYAAAKAAYDVAENELADTRLIAPFDGYIGEVFIEKFQDVKATQPVVTLIEIDKLKIEIYVTQDIAQAMQKKGEISMRFDTEPGRQYRAQVVEVSKSTMDNNLSYLLTAMLPNSDGHLLAGMSGKAQLPASAENSAGGVVIPLSALCHRPMEGDFAWVVDKSKSTVSKRKVKRGQLLPNGRVNITEGLSCDETIATTGLRFLSDGMEVNLER